MGHPSRNLNDNSDEGNVNYKGPVQETRERSNISKWARDYSCGTLVKNVAAFSCYPKNLPETKLKISEQISLAQESSRQPNIDSVS